MSIQPVPELGPVADPGSSSAGTRADVPTHSQPASAELDSGKQSRTEHSTLEPSMDSTQMPRDEVQVQRVNGASGDIVIRYLDASGNLILQIPSSQVLGLARAVEQALEEQANRKTETSGMNLSAQGEASLGY